MTGFYIVPGEGQESDISIGGASFGPVPYKEHFIESVFAYLPKGSFWVPKRGGFFENLLYGIMDAFNLVRVVLSDLAHIRDARLTSQLDDLELDYGVATNPNLTIAQRRAFLNSRINAINNTGSAQEMQAALRLAGFDVFVYPNDPAVDPATIATGSSTLLVNGEVVQSEFVYLMRAGKTNSQAGKTNSRAGKFLQSSSVYNYVLPTNPNAWPFVFFVGGAATFGGSGELLSVAFVDIEAQRQIEFENIVLKYKPLFTWAVLQINYV